MQKLLKKLLKFQRFISRCVVFALSVISCTMLVAGIVYGTYLVTISDSAYEKKIRSIYKQICINSGQSKDCPPLIVNLTDIEDNAYNNKKSIVIFMHLVNHTKSWDEVAFVLGHELAHTTLKHMDYEQFQIDYQTSEASADKMGAVYMMKAGYDICKGREIFKYWAKVRGNTLDGSHPPHVYRYEELNINCN